MKPVVDAAAPGIINFNVAEGTDTFNIDGEILAVIFNDPQQTTSNTIVLLFGAQNPNGDSFHIQTTPINTADPNLALDMSLGISFGFQQVGSNTGQFSTVDVNSQLLTSSAGGQDDGTRRKRACPHHRRRHR